MIVSSESNSKMNLNPCHQKPMSVRINCRQKLNKSPWVFALMLVTFSYVLAAPPVFAQTRHQGNARLQIIVNVVPVVLNAPSIQGEPTILLESPRMISEGVLLHLPAAFDSLTSIEEFRKLSDLGWDSRHSPSLSPSTSSRPDGREPRASVLGRGNERGWTEPEFESAAQSESLVHTSTIVPR